MNGLSAREELSCINFRLDFGAQANGMPKTVFLGGKNKMEEKENKCKQNKLNDCGSGHSSGELTHSFKSVNKIYRDMNLRSYRLHLLQGKISLLFDSCF